MLLKFIFLICSVRIIISKYRLGALNDPRNNFDSFKVLRRSEPAKDSESKRFYENV
jgi:hypothetical protein